MIFDKINDDVKNLKKPSKNIRKSETRSEKPEKLKFVLNELLKLAQQKKIKPVAEHKFAWHELPEAHDGFEKGKYTGKIFIDLNGIS